MVGGCAWLTVGSGGLQPTIASSAAALRAASCAAAAARPARHSATNLWGKGACEGDTRR